MGAITDAAEEGKRKVLEIGAQAGDAGVAAYQQAQQAIKQAQQDALDRAHAASSLIGAAGVNATVDETIQRPTTRILQSLDAGNTMFNQNRAANQASNLSYLEGIKGLEPYVDYLNAAAAAKSGGGRGGGGGGGGRRHSSGDLSDSELRVRVSGAAQIARAQAAEAAQGKAQRTAGKLQARSKQQHQTAQQLKQRPGKYAQVIYKQDPTKAGSGSGVRRRIQEQKANLERLKRQATTRGGQVSGYVQLADGTKVYRGTNAWQQRFGDARLRDLPTGNGMKIVRRGDLPAQPLAKAPASLRHEINATRRSLSRLRTTRDLAIERANAAKGVNRLGRKLGRQAQRVENIAKTPISVFGRDIAMNEYGVDPDTAFGIIGPKEDASFGRAEEYLGKQSYPARYAIAQAVNLSPDKVAKVRGSAAYKEARASARQALKNGVTWEQFQAGQLQPIASAKGGANIAKVLQYELKSLFQTAGQRASDADWQLQQNAYKGLG